MKKKTMMIIVMIILVFFGTACQTWHMLARTEEETETTEGLTYIQVESLTFKRKSHQEIEISWLGNYDDVVETYVIKRRAVANGKGIGEWQKLASLEIEQVDNGAMWQYVDRLPEDAFRQYEYRIDVQVCDTKQYAAIEGKAVLASNVKICIDPGHYSVAREVAEVDEFHYVEGDFVLALGLELQRVLKEEYGIDACLTRDSDTISLSGYTDDELDSAHISLRGEYAAEQDCDLVVSLHTNSNEEEANDYPTFFQPIEINKPIILVNQPAKASVVALKTANGIGVALANVNYRLGIAATNEFKTISEIDVAEIEEDIKVEIKDELPENVASEKIEKRQVYLEEWSKEYNDALDEPGAVFCRTGSKGDDYYGVLRGAANVDIPGMIIEHGFHSVQKVRQAAVDGELKQLWAQADAYGIAYGFGFYEDIFRDFTKNVTE